MDFIAIATLLAALAAGGSAINSGIQNDKKTVNYKEAKKALGEMAGDQYAGILNNPYWQQLEYPEKIALLQEYSLGSYTGALKNINFDQLQADLAEFYSIPTDAPIYTDFVDVDSALSDAQAAIDAENEQLLASLNEDLQRTGESYTQAKDSLLTGQYQRNMQTIDTLANDMARARRNAIESGASAGIRIAENVNALLTAQNKMSQQSLETSNQLAQMLLNQRSAEAGLRNQWHDAQMSTYDRVQGRAQNEMQIGQQRYDQAHSEYLDRLDSATSPTNPLVDRMARYKKNSAYSSNATSEY